MIFPRTCIASLLLVLAWAAPAAPGPGRGGDDSGRGGGGSESSGGGHGSDDRGDRDTGSPTDDGGHGGPGRGGSDDRADVPEPGDIGGNDFDLTDDHSGPGRGRDDGDRDDGPRGGGGGGDRRGGGRGRFDGGGREFEPDVVLAADLGRDARDEALGLGFRVSGHSVLTGLGLTLTRLEIPGGLEAEAARDELARAVPGLLVDLDFHYELSQGTTTCTGLRCFGRDLIRWTGASCAPPAMIIGMLDTAVDGRAPALKGAAIVVRRFGEREATADERGHGTAVAAQLIGAADSDFPGLVPGSTLYAADIFEPDRDGRLDARTAQIVAALDWLAQQKPGVINASFEGPASPLLAEVLKRIIARGIPVVAAAGNGGPEGPPRYPAAFEPVIAVTAVDRFLHVYPLANRGTYVDVAAPGVGIWTTTPDGAGEFRDGTSFAAPFVTAQIAVLRARQPELQGAALAEALDRDALDLGDPGPDVIYGRGLARVAGCAP